MGKLGFIRLAIGAAGCSAWLSGATAASSEGRPTLPADVYARAEQLSPQNLDKLVYDLDVRPSWIDGADALWFKSRDAGGTRFELAEPATGRTHPAFDHVRMAQALGRVLAEPVEPEALPITELAFPKGLQGPPRVTAMGKSFDCDLSAPVCAPAPSSTPDPLTVRGPDGRFAVFAKGPDLWVRDLRTGAERALTSDGAPHRGYGAVAETFAAISRIRMGLEAAPVGDFSPDGARFITYQLDETHVPPLELLQHVPEDGTVRPKAWSYRQPLHSGSPATGTLLIFDLVTGKATRIAHPPSAIRFGWPLALEELAWSGGGGSVLFVDYSRDLLQKTLYRADAATGAVTPLVVERAKTSELNSNVPKFRLLKTGEIVWPSERDGYSHLYLYSSLGTLVRQLTRGEWVVRDIVHVDEAGRDVYFAAGGLHPGQDPYLRHLCRVSLDGTGVRELTPEDADHEVGAIAPGSPLSRSPSSYGGFSKDGRWFVDAYSRVDLPTVTLVRDRDGHAVLPLATAKLSELGRALYRPPEPFTVQAEDGKTTLYGIVMKPRDFDPNQLYPVIDSEYDGPQAAVSPKRYLWDVLTGFHSSRPLAELGFVVVDMDARGKPWRSRAFWDYGYGHLGRGGLPDRVAMLGELGAARPYMDLRRVGVYGYSAGGFAAVHAIMDQPDVYKVAVAVSPYSLMYSTWNWDQTWQGPYDPAGDLAQEPWTNAAQFKGKLLMMVGDMDDVVHPASVMHIADALIKNNKPFDMLVIPNGDHQMILKPYLQQRVWDYFVRNLLGAEPPPGYLVGSSATTAHVESSTKERR